MINGLLWGTDHSVSVCMFNEDGDGGQEKHECKAIKLYPSVPLVKCFCIILDYGVRIYSAK